MHKPTIIAGALFLALSCSHSLTATENGGSVYPVGAETVMPGLTPGAGQTMLYEFTALYQANQLVNSQGKSILPDFHLGVEAVAVKLSHNWGGNVLGANLVTVAAIPLMSVSLTTPAGTTRKTGIGNSAVGQYLAWHKGAVGWFSGMEYWTPGFDYTKGAPLNIGEHYMAFVPVSAVSWLPDSARTEISSRFSYFFNTADMATNYHSGNEAIWEFDAMRAIKRIHFGVNGYFYKQTTNDMLNQAVVGDGNRGRDLAIGPEIRSNLGPIGLVLKFQKDTLVQNRPAGNEFWFQFALPLNHGRE
jgi:hypothetical protein